MRFWLFVCSLALACSSTTVANADEAVTEGLRFQNENGVITVEFTGSAARPGRPGIPSWKAVMPRKEGGNITALHIPADHPVPLGSRAFFPISSLSVRNSEGLEGMMSNGRENYLDFEVEHFAITEHAPDRIVVEANGPSKHGFVHQRRTYTFSLDGVAIESDVTPLVDLASLAFNPHFDLQQIADSHFAVLPVRTQGRHGWVPMPSSGSDGVTRMPEGVDYPLEAELKFKRDTPVYVRLYVDKTFDTHQEKRLFGHNIKEYTAPSGRTFYEKLLIIAGGPALRGEGQTFKVRYRFETRP